MTAKVMEISFPQVGVQSMPMPRQTPSSHRSTGSSANTTLRRLHMVDNVLSADSQGKKLPLIYNRWMASFGSIGSVNLKM